MSEQKPIKKADLARHWGVSRAYLTRLSKPGSEGGKDMPEFLCLPDADAWRLVNAPPRPGNAFRGDPKFAGEQSSSKNDVELAKKTAEDPTPTTSPGTTGAARPMPHPAELGGGRLNVEAMVTKGADFDLLALEHATRVPQIAYGLFELAAKEGNAAVIAVNMKNWSEAAKNSAEIRARYYEIMEKRRVLIPLDEVMDIVGTELQAVRHALEKHGERCAQAANPQDPALARLAIDADIDAIFSAMAQVQMRAQRELTMPAA